MKKLLLSVSAVLLGASVSLQAQDPIDVTIDVEADNYEISPLIYGLNIHSDILEEEKVATSVRKGGNRWTAYNWENNFSNAGSDYKFFSDDYLATHLTDRTKPANVVTTFVEQANANDQYSLITVQMAGYTASGRSGSASELNADNYNTLKIRKDGELSLMPDLTDSLVYIEEFINYIKHYYGTANNGGPNAYSLDNEPVLWSSKHKVLHPNLVTVDELITKSTETAKLIKEYDPNAEVYGFAAFGWHGLSTLDDWHDSESGPDDWQPIRHNYQDTFYVAYLSKMREASDEAGVRLLDALDIHWYPTEQVKGKRIVDLGGDNPDAASDLISERAVELRLQAPRSFWDKTYKPSDGKVGKPAVLTRLHEAIDTLYPGTKISVSEYQFGTEWHISGGLAIADILGIFGREKVYVAQKWDGMGEFAEAAFKLFRNYDGKGNTVGDIYAKTDVSDIEKASAYSSIDAEGNLHIIYVNKQEADIEASFNIANGAYTSAKVYGFGPDNHHIEALDDVSALANGKFSYTVPSFSALHFVLEAKTQLMLLTAETDVDDASVVTVKANGLISNPSVDGFSLMANDKTISASDVAINGEDITITLAEAIPADASKLTLVYQGGTLTDADGLAVKKSVIEFDNMHKDAEVFIVSSEIDADGKTITLTFNTEVSALSGDEPVFTANYDEVRINEGVQFNGKTVIMNLDQTIYSDFVTKLDYKGTIEFESGETMSAFVLTDIINLAPLTPPSMMDIALVDFGLGVEAAFNKAMEIVDANNVGFTVYVNGEERGYVATAENNVVALRFDTKIEAGDKVEFEYADGTTQSIFDSGLLDIEKTDLENNIPQPADVLTLPGKLQVEDLYYYENYTYFETEESGSSETPVLGKFSRGTVLAYRVSSSEAKTYTMAFRSASSGYDATGSVFVNGEKVTDFFLPHNGGWTKWVDSHFPVAVPAGESVISIEIGDPSVNLDFFEFKEEEVIDQTEFRKGTVTSSGSQLNIQFNRLFESIPTADMFEVKSGENVVAVASVAMLSEMNYFKLTLDGFICEDETVSVTFVGDVKNLQGGDVVSETYTDSKNSSSYDCNVTSTKVAELKFSVYPIPFNGKYLNIDSEETVSKAIIYDMNGAVVYENEENVTSIKLNNTLSKGVYSLVLYVGDKVSTAMLIVD